MFRISQPTTDTAFVQDPYSFYDAMRGHGAMFHWDELGMPCAVSYAAVSAILRDRRLGRQEPPDRVRPVPPHLVPFATAEAHSMLQLEPPAHGRLRGLVLRAFTSRRIAGMADEIDAICHDLIDRFPGGSFDLLEHYARPLPAIVICRLLGVPEQHASALLAWSNAMVMMYTPRRSRAIEDAASQAALEFAAFLRALIIEKRGTPADDLLSELIAAEAEGERLSEAELISTCILLLNAGHEATVHTLGNGAALLVPTAHREITPALVEEILRLDPPLHFFGRYVYEDVTLFGHVIPAGTEIGCLLGAANRDPDVYPDAGTFDPARRGAANTSFGAGIHFCVGAPLARLELLAGFRTLFARCPALRLEAQPCYANIYHFHGLERLMVSIG